MTEPTPGPAPEAIAIRDQLSQVNAGSPQALELAQRLESVYRQRYPEPAPSPSPTTSTDTPRERASAPPAETAPRPNVFDDPHAAATTAPLDQVPAPELSPALVKAGFQWDDGLLRSVNAAAKREGVTGLVRDVQHEVARALSEGPSDFATLERQLEQRWGRAYPSKLVAALTALDELEPAVRANLEKYALDVHPGVLDKLARVGEKLLDVTTPGGMERLKVKYAARTG